MAKKKPKIKPIKTTADGNKVKASYRFDAKNERVARLAKAAAAKLVTNVTDETMDAIRILIMRSIREGIPPHDVARLIVGVLGEPGATTNEIPGLIGLNTPQMHAALNYRHGLVDMGHSPSAVDKLMARYVERKLNERSQMIARTEIMWAENVGAQAGYQQAVKQGYLPGSTVLEWITTPDERLCGSCAPMNGKTKAIGMESTFSNGSTGPPLHPRCRCTLGVAAGGPNP
jgi:hypothetical protein